MDSGLKQLIEQRNRTIEKWSKIGLLDGLDGTINENCATLFESQLSFDMTQFHEEQAEIKWFEGEFDSYNHELKDYLLS